MTEPASSGIHSVHLAIDVSPRRSPLSPATNWRERPLAGRQAKHRDQYPGICRRSLSPGYRPQPSSTSRYAVRPPSRLPARHASDPDANNLAEGPMRHLRRHPRSTGIISFRSQQGAHCLAHARRNSRRSEISGPSRRRTHATTHRHRARSMRLRPLRLRAIFERACYRSRSAITRQDHRCRRLRFAMEANCRGLSASTPARHPGG